MSYYFNYYLGYRNKEDNQIYPFGPFDKDGKLECIHFKSRSFTSNLYEYFSSPKLEEVSLELYERLLTDESIRQCRDFFLPKDSKKELDDGDKAAMAYMEEQEYKTLKDAYDDFCHVKILPLSALPSGDYIKEGYVLSSQIGAEYNDDFYPVLSCHEYAERLKTVLALGNAYKTSHISDLTGEEISSEEDNIANFIYHKWIDRKCLGYDATMIARQADLFNAYGDSIVIVETEG